MPPLPSFDSKDAIPEAFRDAYVEREGKWVPDDSDTKGLRENNRRILEDKRRVDEEIARMRSIFGNRKIEDVEALLKQQQADEDERQLKAGEAEKVFAKRLAEAKAEWEREREPLLRDRQELTDMKVDVAIRDAAAKAGVIPEDMRLVIPIVKGSRVKYDEKTGKVGVYDADGDLTGSTVEKFFAETFKTEAPKFYQASGGSGGGAQQGGSGGRTPAGTVAVTDHKGFLDNLDKIGKGEMKVAIPSGA